MGTVGAASSFEGTARFQILEQIGSGGMGVVYEALDRETQARVALKTLLHLDGASLLRFKNEFRSLRSLNHRNLVSLGELFEHEGRWFFTMERIHGTDFLCHLRGTSATLPGEWNPDEETAPIKRPLSPPERPPTAPAVGPVDEARLRSCLAQLVSGVHSLHAARKVHRDLKPSNVLVTDAGRVVILDFGLVRDFDAQAERGTALSGSEQSFIGGTLSFMAPEQAGGNVGPAADWYSLGVLLYLVLTGKLPVRGRADMLLELKRTVEPVRPSLLAAGVPSDLDELCTALLRIDPTARPTGREILGRLGVVEELQPIAPHDQLHGRFVGRAAELAELREQLARVVAGQAVTVLVHGPSGLGKSALVRQFTQELGASPVVLAGRCHEREAVPYKAIDEVTDALSRYLRELPGDVAASLVPPDAALLAGVFPVLKQCEAIAATPLPALPPGDPHERRSRVFAALRELLVRIGRLRPLVVCIDDLHWTDDDSLRLLRDILRPPMTPRMLLVVTVRTAPEAHTGHVTPDELIARLGGGVTVLSLEKLPPADARALVVRLARDLPEASAIGEESILAEADGHPLFIDALVQHRASERVARPIRLDDALYSRIVRLEQPAQALLQLVSIVGGPVTQAAALRAGGFAPAELEWCTAALCNSRLALSGGMRPTDTIEPYHDRVRETVVARLDPAVRVDWHRRLAVAFEELSAEDPGTVDAELLAVHWRGAGDSERARHYLFRAAGEAEQVLAFERAARLYQLGLELSGEGAVDTRGLRVKLGDALANAGRGGEAAAAYLAAVADRAGAGDDTRREDLELQRRAAEQYLRSGHFDEGLRALTTVLESIGMSIPKTPQRALLSLLLRRAQIGLRGFAFDERQASEIAADALIRIDICWTAAIGFGMADLVRGNDFQTRQLLLALRAGEPYRVAKALAVEAGYLGTIGKPGLRNTSRVLGAARAVAERLQHPHALGLAALFDGYRAFLIGSWSECRRLMEHAETILRDRCTGVAWEINNARLLCAWALGFMGEIRVLSTRMPFYIEDAKDRGDLFAMANLRNGLPNIPWLARDDADGARRQIAEAMGGWSQQGFHLQHYYTLHAETDIDLYRGDVRAAQLRVADEWPRLARSLLLRVQLVRINSTHVRARSLIARATAESGSLQRSLLRQAERDARRLAREKLGWADGDAELIRAGIANTRGDRDETVRRLRSARERLLASDMRMHAAAAARRLGALLGGDEGRSLLAEADDWIAREQVRDPARMTAMLVPGWRD